MFYRFIVSVVGRSLLVHGIMMGAESGESWVRVSFRTAVNYRMLEGRC